MMGNDIKEVNLQSLDIVSYLRGISNNGESGNLDIHKIFNLHYRGFIGNSVTSPYPNDLEPGFYYKNKIVDYEIEKLYPYNDGYILVFNIATGILQIYIHPTNLGITIRSKWGGIWYQNVIK
ncbi:hypothetical protein NXX33_20585 [Bacteroides fragilis]|nr:hypothetical protein [Bacteroides fragilis]